MIALFVCLGVALLLAIVFVVIYNRMVVHRNTYRNALKQIDVALKQRHDMIPALVSAVKGYMAHERETLDAVISARNEAQTARESLGDAPSADQMAALAASEKSLSAGLMRVFALSEAYPDLKASQNFSDLQAQIARMEDKISAARRGYNLTVLEYNNAIETFPSNMVAGAFSFARAEELDLASDEPDIKTMPAVEF